MSKVRTLSIKDLHNLTPVPRSLFHEFFIRPRRQNVADIGSCAEIISSFLVSYYLKKYCFLEFFDNSSIGFFIL